MAEAVTGATTYNPQCYQAIVIAKALELYAQHGMRVNRAYTPSAMMRMATSITGKRFKTRDYTGAATALREWSDSHVQS